MSVTAFWIFLIATILLLEKMNHWKKRLPLILNFWARRMKSLMQSVLTTLRNMKKH